MRSLRSPSVIDLVEHWDAGAPVPPGQPTAPKITPPPPPPPRAVSGETKESVLAALSEETPAINSAVAFDEVSALLRKQTAAIEEARSELLARRSEVLAMCKTLSPPRASPSAKANALDSPAGRSADSSWLLSSMKSELKELSTLSAEASSPSQFAAAQSPVAADAATGSGGTDGGRAPIGAEAIMLLAAAQVRERRRLWSSNAAPRSGTAWLGEALGRAHAIAANEARSDSDVTSVDAAAAAAAAALSAATRSRSSAKCALAPEVLEWLGAVRGLAARGAPGDVAPLLQAAGYTTLPMCATLSARDIGALLGAAPSLDATLVALVAAVRELAQVQQRAAERGATSAHFLLRAGYVTAQCSLKAPSAARAAATTPPSEKRAWCRLYCTGGGGGVQLLTLHDAPLAAAREVVDVRGGLASVVGGKLVVETANSVVILGSSQLQGWRLCFEELRTDVLAQEGAARVAARVAAAKEASATSAERAQLQLQRAAETIGVRLASVRGVSDLGAALAPGPGGASSVIRRFVSLADGSPSPLKTRGWVSEGMVIRSLNGANVEALPHYEVVRVASQFVWWPLGLVCLAHSVFYFSCSPLRRSERSS